MAEYWDGRRGDPLGAHEGETEAVHQRDWRPRVRCSGRPGRQAKVNGKDGHWVRIRIDDGGFYRKNTIKWTDGSEDIPTKTNSITVTETVAPALTDLAWWYIYALATFAAGSVFRLQRLPVGGPDC